MIMVWIKFLPDLATFRKPELFKSLFKVTSIRQGFIANLYIWMKQAIMEF
jgi:hypothetical protein